MYEIKWRVKNGTPWCHLQYCDDIIEVSRELSILRAAAPPNMEYKFVKVEKKTKLQQMREFF